MDTTKPDCKASQQNVNHKKTSSPIIAQKNKTVNIENTEFEEPVNRHKRNIVKNETEQDKKTMLEKFWESPLGKKLPIGGPMKWFRGRVPLDNQPEKKQSQVATKSVVPKRPFKLWNNLKRRFIWKTSSHPIRASSISEVHPKIEDAVLDMPNVPTDNHRSTSRQYVWKTSSTVPRPNSTISSDSSVFETIPVSPLLRTNQIPQIQNSRPMSPFFSSKFIWRSESVQRGFVSPKSTNHSQGKLLDAANPTKSKNARKSFLWKSDDHTVGRRAWE